MSGRPEDWLDELFDREIQPHHAKDYDPKDLVAIALDANQDVEVRLEAVQTLQAWVEHQHNTVMRPEMVKRAEHNFQVIDDSLPKMDAMKPAAQNYVAVLGGVWRQPEQAIEAFGLLADKHGVEYALDVMHKDPEQLGELRGKAMFGWKNDERKTALAALAKIDDDSRHFWQVFSDGRVATAAIKTVIDDEKTPEMKAYRAMSITVAGLAMDEMTKYGSILNESALDRYKQLRADDPLAAWIKATDEAKSGPWPAVDPYCHRWRREQKAMAQRVMHDKSLMARAQALGILEDVRTSADPFYRPPKPPKPPVETRLKPDHGGLSGDLARLQQAFRPAARTHRL